MAKKEILVLAGMALLFLSCAHSNYIRADEKNPHRGLVKVESEKGLSIGDVLPIYEEICSLPAGSRYRTNQYQDCCEVVVGEARVVERPDPYLRKLEALNDKQFLDGEFIQPGRTSNQEKSCGTLTP